MFNKYPFYLIIFNKKNDANDLILRKEDINIENVLINFAAGIFAVPDYLNKEVVGLLCIMLQVDPLKRATTAQIR